MPLIDHLRELRKRVLSSAIAIVVAFGGGWYFYNSIIVTLAKPVCDLRAAQASGAESCGALYISGVLGPLDLQIKAGTQSGTTVSIKGKGMTRLRSTHRGDLIVHVDIETPHKLNREQEKLLKEFAKARGEKDGDVTLKRHQDGLFAKFRDAFHR